MKRIVKFLGVTAAVLVVSAGLAVKLSGVDVFAGNAASSAGSAPTIAVAGGTISVSGQGAVKAKPDIAYIDVGVVTEDKDAAKAQGDNADKVDALVKALKKAGVSEDDIVTSGYYMYPQYAYEYDKNGNLTNKSILAYYVSNTVNVTVRDIAKVGAVIDVAGGGGANMINGVRYSISDSTGYYEKALAQAYEAAFKRAKALADAAGVVIGKPIVIHETSGYYAPVAYAESDKGYGAANDAAMEAPSYAPTQTFSGDLTISASVSAEFGY